MGARLHRYTGNDTYGDLAEKTWDLIERLGYISDEYDVYDGAHLPDCTEINKAQFSYNAAMLLQGAAFMYNTVRPILWPLFIFAQSILIKCRILVTSCDLTKRSATQHSDCHNLKENMLTSCGQLD